MMPLKYRNSQQDFIDHAFQFVALRSLMDLIVDMTSFVPNATESSTDPIALEIVNTKILELLPIDVWEPAVMLTG